MLVKFLELFLGIRDVLADRLPKRLLFLLEGLEAGEVGREGGGALEGEVLVGGGI